MIAFILAGIVFVGTLAYCALMILAAGMSDSPSAAADIHPLPVFIGGTIIAALIAASHWLHIGW